VEDRMATAKSRIAHKHFRLDASKIIRVRRVLRASTETEAIDRALDLVLDEHARNRLELTEAINAAAKAIDEL
jgi:hypothetical protein